MRQKFFITPFAATGDRASPPDPQQPDGSVSYSVGFGPDYEADPASSPNAKPVPRAETNGLFYDLSAAVSALQREGVPEFITPADNGGAAFPYSRGAVVRWSASGEPPFATYVSRVDNNVAAPSVAASWAPLIFEGATAADAIAGTSSTLIVTPAALKAAMDAASITVPDASTSVKGIQRNATNAEAQAGELGNVTITALALRSALQAYSFNAAQIGSGTFDLARIPSLPASRIDSGTFDPARIPPINIGAGQVTSGVLPVARGGTGAASFPAGRYLVGGGGAALQTLTPDQVRGDIRAAGTGANTFTGTQTVRSEGTAEVALEAAGALSGGIFSRAGETVVYAEGGALHLRPSGRLDSGAALVLRPFGATLSTSLTATGGFQGSSRTVKTDDAPCPYGLAEVLRLDSRSFRYLPEYRDDGGRRSLGFYAEDLAEIIPEMVSESDGRSPLVVESNQLLPVLVRALQEMADHVEKLESRIKKLESPQ